VEGLPLGAGALLSPEFTRLREARHIRLVTYGDVIKQQGLSAMRAPQQ